MTEVARHEAKKSPGYWLEAIANAGWGRLPGSARLGRPLLLIASAAALLISMGRQGEYTDAPAVFANALACGWLGHALVATLLGRQLGMARWMVVAWVFLGVIRACVILWGAPQGWVLTQAISVEDRHATSQTRTTDLSFGAGSVPAHLINDKRQFNFRGDRDEEPKRTELPVAVTAKAYAAGQGTLRISSSSPLRVSIGPQVIELRPPIIDHERQFSLAGEEVIEIAMISTGVDKAALRVQPIGTTLYAEPTVGPLMAFRRWLGGVAGVLDLFVIAGSLWMIVVAARSHVWHLSSRSRQLSAGLMAIVLVLGLGPHLITWFSQHESLVVLSGGDDWLTYESYARDIRENSLLMLNGKLLGHADAFYYQPLYPYVVAFAHLLVGESPQGVVLLQLLGVGLVLVLAFLTIGRGLLPAVSLILVVFGTGILTEWLQMAQRLLSENLLTVLLAVLLFLVSRLSSVPNRRHLALIGIILGVASLARTTAWAAVPFLLVLLLRGVPRKKLPGRLAAVLVPMVVLASLVPVRNALAAGTPAFLPTSGSINLYLGNVPTGRKLTTEPWIGLSKQYDARLVSVAEAVVNAPDQVAKKIADKAVYVLGFPRTLDADNPAIFWPVLSLWLLALLGLLTRQHSRIEWTCLILAVTHALSLVVVFPHNYYYRLMMPATLPLAIWDAIALAGLLTGLPEPSWAGSQVKRLVSRPGMEHTSELA